MISKANIAKQFLTGLSIEVLARRLSRDYGGSINYWTEWVEDAIRSYECPSQ